MSTCAVMQMDKIMLNFTFFRNLGLLHHVVCTSPSDWSTWSADVRKGKTS